MTISICDRLRFTSVNKIYDRKYVIFKARRLQRHEAADILVSLTKRYEILQIEYEDFNNCCITIMDYFNAHLGDYVVISVCSISDTQNIYGR